MPWKYSQKFIYCFECGAEIYFDDKIFEVDRYGTLCESCGNKLFE